MGQKVAWGHLCWKTKSRATSTQPWNQKLSTFIKERIPQRYLLKPKTDQKLKVLLGLIVKNKKNNNWIPCLCFFQLNNNFGIVTWCQGKIWIFLMNVLLNMYICALRKNRVPLLLCWWYFTFLQLYSEKFRNIYFHDQMFFQTSVAKGNACQ